MSVLEMVRTKVKELTDPNGPANELLHSAKSAVAHGLDGAGKFVDEKTHGKYSSQINTGVHKAKEFLREEKQDGEQEPGGAAGGGAATAEPPSAESAAPSAAEGMTPSTEDSEAPPPKPPGPPAASNGDQPPQP